MWKQIWADLKRAKPLIVLDRAHLTNNRNGRYSRGMGALGRILGSGEPLGYRHFARHGSYDLSYLVVWCKEEYEESGKYMVFRIFYTRGNQALDEIAYRKFVFAEICCFYDGETPNPGRVLLTREDAILCMKGKRAYHEI